jgi:hypothetical protein
MTLASVRAYKDKLEEWGYKKYNARRKVPVPAAASLDVARDLGDEEFAQVASALVYWPMIPRISLKEI